MVAWLGSISGKVLQREIPIIRLTKVIKISNCISLATLTNEITWANSLLNMLDFARYSVIPS